MRDVKSAILRVKKFLDEWGKMRGLHPEEIAGLHAGDPRESTLNASDLRALLESAQAAGWLGIESAPKEGKTMFVVRAFDVEFNGIGYTSDPWCVWRGESGSFVRWPHPFPPTHWMPLPDRPYQQEDRTQ